MAAAAPTHSSSRDEIVDRRVGVALVGFVGLVVASQFWFATVEAYAKERWNVKRLSARRYLGLAVVMTIGFLVVIAALRLPLSATY